MRKSIETTDAGRIIHTTNGVDTRSHAVYVREIKAYDQPLENGFNLELATDVIEQIKRTPLLWNQGAWRSDIDLEHLEALQGSIDPWNHRGFSSGAADLFADLHNDEKRPTLADLKDELKDYVDTEATACGTSMCFAGWVAELTGADYLVDMKGLKARTNKTDPDTRVAWEGVALDSLLVTREQAEEWGIGNTWFPAKEYGYAQVVLDSLAERGFTKETHCVISVSLYASHKLGMQGSDRVELFAGENSFGDIEEKIARMVEHGPMVSEYDDDDDEGYDNELAEDAYDPEPVA